MGCRTMVQGRVEGTIFWIGISGVGETMEIIKDNIDEVLVEAGYEYIEKYPDSQLNSFYNYWYFLDEYEKELYTTKNISLDVILYSKYYWLSRLADQFHEVYGFDAGVEQQQFKIMEELDQRIDNVDWNFVEKLKSLI